MNKNMLLAIVTVALFSGIHAQPNTIKISGTRLAYPLFHYWIQEYSKTYKGIKFVINSDLPSDSSDLLIAAYAVQPGELKAGKQLIAVSRYVQLPVANSNRKDLPELQQKGFTIETIKQLYFNDQVNSRPVPSTHLFTIYTREKPACASKAFAGHFGNQPKDIKGVRVPGDDMSLLEVVKKDSGAISYNNLGFIYNLHTRKVKDSIAVIPIDINENGKVDANENIYNTLDEVVTFAEKSNSGKLVIENVNVIVNKDFTNPAAKEFLTWILKHGQQYNYQTGFLKLRDAQIEDQSAILSASFNGDILDQVYGKQD